LEKDLLEAQEQVAALNKGDIKLKKAKAQRLRRRAEGLAELWQRHQASEPLKAVHADYIVGGLVSVGGKELFDKPKEILRVPIFRSRSFIIGHFMVGIETTNVPLRSRGN
jgi:hypothetical protein